MKTIGIILIILLIALAIAVYYYVVHITTELANLKFKVKLNEIDFSKFNILDYTKAGAKVLTKIQIDLTNSTNLNLSFKNLYIEVYNKGILIAQTSPNIFNKKKITISKHSNILTVQEFIVYLNKGLIDLAVSIKAGTAVLEYKIKVNWFGFNISQQVINKIN